MHSKFKPYRKWLASLSLGILSGLYFTGCFFGDNSSEVDLNPGPNSIPSTQCSDLNAAQQKTGDSLVNLAQKLQTGDVDMMVSLKEGNWKSINETRANQAITLYDQALKAAPGHCGAIFGKAMARTGILLQDMGVNEAVNQSLNKRSAANAKQEFPLAQAFKANRDEAAPIILRVASGLAGANKPFITEQQERLSVEVLPQLDSIIASLNAVMAKGEFSFAYSRPDGHIIEIDAGEVGPMLGGLKVARAILLVICGYQWEVAKNGSYAWMDHISGLNQADLNNLTTAQKSDMDHLTGLFKVGSAFTRVKPQWKNAVQGIPSLLLEAIENSQAGLRYALWESRYPDKQAHDLYRVGTSELDDVDPKEISGMIDALERTKKYLKGDVALEYHKGTHTLRINFPKIFAWDGLQNYLPQFTIRPYEQWSIPLSHTDSGYEQQWNPEIRSGSEAFRTILQALDLPYSDAIGVRSGPEGRFTVVLSEEENGWFNNSYRGPDIILATLEPGARGCEFNYTKLNGRVRMEPSLFPNLNTFAFTESTGKGTITLGRTCFVTNEIPSYLEYENTSVLRPFYFTNLAGTKTLEIDEVSSVVDDLGIAALTGKIVFKDPTFGGVFPDITNENIWSTIQSLEYAGANLNEICDEYGNCTRELPNNPSDLDVWAHYLYWMDDLF